MKVISFVGARPQFVKEALVGAAVRRLNSWEHILVHSGQHYDSRMSDVFFQEFGIPEPQYHLGVGSGTHAAMTAAAMTGIEDVLLKENPDAILVYGDTNTTLAGALAAVKIHIPVVHVEAGIRMLPRTMPEEINRVLVDRIAAVLCCCSAVSKASLAKEGITNGVAITGDVMYDCFLRMRPRFFPEKACETYMVEPGEFIIATLHRDYNVDSPQTLRGCLEGLALLQRESGMRVVLPVHPRTRKNIEGFGCNDVAQSLSLTTPIGYLDLMSLLDACAMVVTDSGGLQKEAYYAGKRAAVVMPDTGWRELTECGWNRLCTPEKGSIAKAGAECLTTGMAYPINIYGGGDAAEKIVQAVSTILGRQNISEVAASCAG